MKTAVIFPGIGYTADRPLLYYAGRLALECGYERLVRVRSGYVNSSRDRAVTREALDALLEEAEKKLAGTDWANCEDILFISKSIGTAAACAYAQSHGLKARHLLYTPLTETFSFRPVEGLVFIGTKDPYSDPEEVVRLSLEAGLQVRGIEGGNHSLETGDVPENIGVLAAVMRESRKYIMKEDHK